MQTIYFGKQSGTFDTATGDTDFVSSLWATDGTASGTTLITQFDSGTNSLAGVDNITPTNVGVAFEGASVLRVTDGTTAGTSVTSLPVGGIANAFGEIVFGANASKSSANFGLWASNGSPGNAALIKTIFGNFGTDTLTDFTVFNGELYFIANFSGSNGLGGSNGVYNGQLWKSDGTAAGTVLVQSLSVNDAYHPDLVVSGGNLYFGGNTSSLANDPRLFKIDGNGTTSLVKDISSSSVTTGSPTQLTDVFGTLFFVTNDGTHGEELWKSDGTAAGTVLVKDINPGTANGSPNNLTSFAGSVYFSANTTAAGSELWKSNGTAAGTVMVKDIVAGSGSSSPSDFVVFNGALYFSAVGGIWKTDGSTAGTTLVDAGVTMNNPVVAGGSLYFEFNTGGQESLFRSDGTAAGTVPIAAGVDPKAGIAVSGAAPPGLVDDLTDAQQLELIYIGYFNRAADNGGFTFWTGQNTQAGDALTNIADAFTPQPETFALYPFLSSVGVDLTTPASQASLATVIANVYQNLFERAPDPAGAAYWLGQVSSGAVPLGAAILAIANGALNGDAITVLNKIAVALDFTTRTGASGLGTTTTTPAFLAAAHSVLNGVDGTSLNDASVTAGMNATTAFISSGQAIAPSALSASDTITVSTSNTVIDPGAGNHTIQFIAGVSGDTLMLHGDATDQIEGFDVEAHDVLDLRGLLAGAALNAQDILPNLGAYFTIVDRGADASLMFDPTGHGGGGTVAVLANSGSTVTSFSRLISDNAALI